MFHLTDFIIGLGYLAIFGTIFAESGLLIGFFLPGDSLLFTAGVFASQGYFNIWILIVGGIIAAIVGDSVGYYIGKKYGQRLFNRPDSLLFKQEYVTKTQHYFEKYGKRTIIIARFIPVVRTFAPVMAGIGNMHYPTFIRYNIIGGFLWAGGILLVSYELSSRIPAISDYLHYIIVGIIAVSFIPVFHELWKTYRARKG